jgi:hypothetical protein
MQSQFVGDLYPKVMIFPHEVRTISKDVRSELHRFDPRVAKRR